MTNQRRLRTTGCILFSLVLGMLATGQAKAGTDNLDKRLRVVYEKLLSERRQAMELFSQALGAQDVAGDQLALLRTLEEGGLRMRRGGLDVEKLQRFVEASIEMQEELLAIAKEKKTLDEESRKIYKEGLEVSHKSIQREWTEANPLLVQRLKELGEAIASASKESSGKKGLGGLFAAAKVIKEGRKLANTKKAFTSIRQMSARNRELDNAFREILKEKAEEPVTAETTPEPAIDASPDLPALAEAKLAALASLPATDAVEDEKDSGSVTDNTGTTKPAPAVRDSNPQNIAIANINLAAATKPFSADAATAEQKPEVSPIATRNKPAQNSAAKTTASEEDAPAALYGGFLLAGNYDELASTFPYTFPLIYQTRQGDDGSMQPIADDFGRYKLVDNGAPALYRFWFNFHKALRAGGDIPGVRLLMTKDEEGANETTLALGLVLAREDVGILKSVKIDPRSGKVNTRYFANITLCFHYMLLDYDAMTVRASQPFYIGFDHFFGNQPPTRAEITKTLRSLYMGNGIEESLAARHARAQLARLRPWPANLVALQVTDVSIQPPAQAALELETEEECAAFERLLGSSFAADLAAGLAVPVVPGAKDLVNGGMSLAFPDNSVRMFQVPEGFFTVAVDVQAFHRSVRQTTDASQQFLLGSYIHTRISQPAAEIVLWDGQTKYAGAPKWIQNELIPQWDFAFTFRDLLSLTAVRAIEQMTENKKFNKEVIQPCRGK